MRLSSLPGRVSRRTIFSNASGKEERMPRGRPPKGPDIVDSLEGDNDAKLRLKTVLETVTGELSIAEACERLEICEARFHRLRQDVLQIALDDLKPKRLGRPPRKEPSEKEKRLTELEKENDQLKFELYAAFARTELAFALPHVITDEGREMIKKKAEEARRYQAQQKKCAEKKKRRTTRKQERKR